MKACKWPDYGGTCQLGNEPRDCLVCNPRPPISKQPNQAFCNAMRAQQTSPANMEAQDAWNAAIDAAAQLLQEWTAFWDAEGMRDRLNDHGKLIMDAQRSNQESCIGAIRLLRYNAEFPLQDAQEEL